MLQPFPASIIQARELTIKGVWRKSTVQELRLGTSQSDDEIVIHT